MEVEETTWLWSAALAAGGLLLLGVFLLALMGRRDRSRGPDQT